MKDLKFNYDQYKTLAEKAKWFAYFHHGVTLHMYDGKSYFEAHLEKVVAVAQRYIHLIPEEKADVALAACWVHDLIWDARVSYNDIKALLGHEVAELAYALSESKGRTRFERFNHEYYQGIRDTFMATFVKLADRIANVESGLITGHGMVKKYQEEHAHFEDELRYEFAVDTHAPHRIFYDEMWEYLRRILMRDHVVS